MATRKQHPPTPLVPTPLPAPGDVTITARIKVGRYVLQEERTHVQTTTLTGVLDSVKHSIKRLHIDEQGEEHFDIVWLGNTAEYGKEKLAMLVLEDMIAEGSL